MTNDNKEQIRGMLFEYLQHLEAIGKTRKRGNSGGNVYYNCPICGSGTGQGRPGTETKGDAAFCVTGNVWHCFAGGCNQGGDVYTLAAKVNNLNPVTDFPEVKKIVADALNMPIYTPYTHNEVNKGDKGKETKANTQRANNMQIQTAETEQPKQDYRAFIADCHNAAGQTEYFIKRGFTPETIKRFSLGLLTAEIKAKYTTICNLEYYFNAGDWIIPYPGNDNYFMARHTPEYEKKVGRKTSKPKTSNAGREPIFNIKALDHAAADTPVFICEAPLDAISVMQAGGIAVALGGTAIAKQLKIYLDSKPDFATPLVIALDDGTTEQEKGRKAAAEIAEYLEEKNIAYSYLEYPNADTVEKTDCNAFLMADAEQFKAAVQTAKSKALEAVKAKAAELTAEYNKNSGAARLDSFIQLWESNHGRAIPTGFKFLDTILDGGLYPGLYAIGAISSLGKTTYTQQIADQIAAAGYDVLFFSLEMAADELTAKTLSRLTAIISRESGNDYNNGLTCRAFTSPTMRENWKQYASRRETVEKAHTRYRSFAGNIFIMQGLGDISAEDVKKAVQKHKQARGKTPIVIIDYVQIMAAYGERLTDKQNMDKNIVELKRISRDENTPVIAISSFNRDNYTAPVSMAAFKESGAIEYTSDVVIALQPQGMIKGDKDTDKSANRETIERCKNSELRRLEIVVLKNRNGRLGTVLADYRTLFNLYDETGEKKKDTANTAEAKTNKWKPF